MSIPSLLGGLQSAARTLLGLPGPEQDDPVFPAEVRNLGVQPVRAWPTAGTLIKFYYKITNTAGTGPNDFTLIAELGGQKLDLAKHHRTLVAALSSSFFTAGSLRLEFPNYYVDGSDVQRPLANLKVKLWYEQRDGSEGFREIGPGGWYDTSTFSTAEERGTYRTVRFFAWCAVDAEPDVIHEFDPLIILVPKRP